MELNEELKVELEKYLSTVGREVIEREYNHEYFDNDFSFQIEIEEGSIKVRFRWLGNIAFTVFVAYGGLRTTVDYMVKDAQRVTEVIVENLNDSVNIEREKIVRVERRLGTPGRIQRVFKKIDKLKKNDGLSDSEKSLLIGELHRELLELVDDLDSIEMQMIELEVVKSKLPLPSGREVPKEFVAMQMGTIPEDVRIYSSKKDVPRLPPKKD